MNALMRPTRVLGIGLLLGLSACQATAAGQTLDVNVQFWAWALLLLPLIFAFAVERSPVNTLFFFGVVSMYGALFLMAVAPLVGLVAAASLFGSGITMVVAAGVLHAVLRALDRAPNQTAAEIDRILSARARRRVVAEEEDAQEPGRRVR